MLVDFCPLPWGEGGESSEPSEGFLPTEPRNFGIRVYSKLTVLAINSNAAAGESIKAFNLAACSAGCQTRIDAEPQRKDVVRVFP